MTSESIALIVFLGMVLPVVLIFVDLINPKFNLPVSKGLLFLITIIFIIISVLLEGVQMINYGTVGVISRFGQVTDRTLDPGLHIKLPLAETVLIYNTQKVIYETMMPQDFTKSKADYKDGPVDTTTQDGQQVDVRYTIRFAVDPTQVKNIANNLGAEWQLVEKIVKAESRVKVRNIVRSYTAEQLYTGDIDQAQEEIRAELEGVFAGNGIILDFFGIRQIGFQSEYISAIEAKQIEKEKVQAEKFRAEQEEFKKQAAITKAEGEAKAQQLQRQTLSKELLSKLWIEKWDGNLPTYLGGNGGTLLQLPTIK